mmetsp:Transcript_14164/g.22546  ORF Transcript_14164/g.22546 Transcript_14164/m.22546 type:complete len:349 (-) Transcript_14164:164-1210(-)
MLTVRIVILVMAAASVASSRVNKIARLNGLEKKSAGGVIQIKAQSVQGCKSFYECQGGIGSWKNQDQGVVKKATELTLLGVFDGHGKNGERVSMALRKKFEDPKLFKEMASKTSDVASLKVLIANALESVNRQFATSSGGSTAVIALVLHDQLLVANVGDSRAIFLTRSEGKLKAKPLTIDQTPCFEGKMQDEDKRLQDLPQCEYDGTRTGWGYRLASIVKKDMAWVNKSCAGTSGGSIIRLVTQSKWGMCGARFTRSVGDGECGDCTPADPVFTVHPLVPSDAFLVLASDGLTEFLDNKQIAGIVNNAGDNLEIAMESLFSKSRQLWLKEEDNEYVDDTTIILAKLG